MIVVDANVLLAAILPTPESELVDGVAERDADWHAPLLWQSEVRNALLGYVRRRGLGLDSALEAYSRADRLLHEKEHLLAAERVLELALESGSTAYDCEYVALAEALATRLVSFDAALLKAFDGVAVHPADFVAA
ncbi:MAG: type II toxin-antitoxin system VapC family toxin [Longimicrobiales bacterium]